MGRPLLLAALLLPPAAGAAEAEDLEFQLDGYYRARGYAFTNLFTEGDATGRFMTHKLRLQPSAALKGRGRFVMMADAFEDVVWGDNESAAATSIFAADPTNDDLDGQPTPDFQVKRAWMEVNLPVGLLRVGRQPSDWGLGLLANDGNGFDDLFGENHDGSTYDRIVFATRPLAITDALAGFGDPDLPLYVAFGLDRLVEDPLIQYYGTSCDAGDPADDDLCAPDEDHGYTEERSPDDREMDWWVDPDDDVWEAIYVVIFRGRDVPLAGHPADLTAGAYVVNRVQVETDSNVWIYDGYLDLAWRGVLLQGEGVLIDGRTSAIALPGAYDPSGSVEDPLVKEAFIPGGVVRLGYRRPAWTAMLEAGYAAGDDNIADQELVGRGLHPDYNVGLLLYEEILDRVTRLVWTEAADGLWSRGGVYNSRYLFPNVRWRPLDGWELVAAWLVAFPDNPDGAIIRTDEDSDARILGHELDAALKIRWADHFDFSLEGGHLWLTDRIPWDNLGLTRDGRVFTLQSRLAFVF